MQLLKKYLIHYPVEVILAPLFKMLEALMDLFVPLIIAHLLNQSMDAILFPSIACLIALSFLGFGFSAIAQYFSAKASSSIAKEIREELFHHIQTLSFSQLDQLGENKLITHLTNDISILQNALNLALRLLLRSPFIVFGSILMSYFIHPKEALFFSFVIPILFLIVFTIMFITLPLYQQVQSSLEKVTQQSRESLNGIRVIRAFHKERFFSTLFQRANTTWRKLSEKVGVIASLMNPLTYLAINLAAIGLIYTGAIEIQQGSMQQGDLVALYNYSAQVLVELIKLASLLVTINRGLASSKRIQETLAVKSTLTFPSHTISTTTQSELEFKNVSFHYPSHQVNSIQHISFHLYKGQSLGILGGTGSGKSTLLQLIPRFYDIQEGEIHLNGIPVQQYPQSQLMNQFGIALQKATLFEGSIKENLLYRHKTASEEELWKALEIAQAKEFVQDKEGQLDFHLEQKGRNLSGGQKQRLCIARALVQNTEFLLLDDVSSALDLATEARLRKSLQKLKNTTKIIVSQRISFLKHCDQILVLDKGKQVGLGSHEELLAHCPIYQEIYASQYQEKGGSYESL